MKTAECVECGKTYVVPARQVGPATCSYECRLDYLERKRICVKCMDAPASRAGYCRNCYPKTKNQEFLGPSDKAIREYEQRYGVKFPWWLQVDYVEGREGDNEVSCAATH